MASHADLQPLSASVPVPIHLLVAKVQQAGVLLRRVVQPMRVDVARHGIGQQVANRVAALQLVPHLWNRGRSRFHHD